jgi:signal transduction histidine kinase
VTSSAGDVERVLRLAAEGRNNSDIARRVGVSRTTVRMWRRGNVPQRQDPRPCRLPLARDRWPTYAYLLGQYLGDGYVATHRRGVHRLRITCTTAYPWIMLEVGMAMCVVMPENKVSRQNRGGCTDVASYSKHWPCLFPQHGPGMKHSRPIVLAEWQREIADEYPEELVRGLIHSDGCRNLNRVKGTDYPRYQFTNRSDDIRRIFTDALDQLGIAWRVMNRYNISVAKRDHVARLDAFVGPKHGGRPVRSLAVDETRLEAVDEPEPSAPAWPLVGRAITALAALTALAAGSGPVPRLACIAAIATSVAVIWKLAATAGGRPPNVRVISLASADLVLVGLAVVGATHYHVSAVALLAAVPPVALHAGQGDRDRGLVVGACALAMATAGAVAAPTAQGANVVGAAGGGVVLAWIAVAVARSTEHQRVAETIVRDSTQALADFRNEIVTTVSHEVRTPLTLIQGLTATLAHRWPQLDEAAKLDLVDTISLNVASLDSSILHFVDAARIARGEFPFEPEAIDLADALGKTEAKLATALAGHTVHATLRAPTVWADREALVRVLEHLISNAVRFSPLGSPILVRSEEGDGGVHVSVTDRGRGIDATDRERIWDPLWRGDVKDTGVSRGAGLGLTIVRQLVEAHGGTATVTWSAAGKGSTFEVTFPAR